MTKDEVEALFPDGSAPGKWHRGVWTVDGVAYCHYVYDVGIDHLAGINRRPGDALCADQWTLRQRSRRGIDDAPREVAPCEDCLRMAADLRAWKQNVADLGRKRARDGAARENIAKVFKDLGCPGPWRVVAGWGFVGHIMFTGHYEHPRGAVLEAGDVLCRRKRLPADVIEAGRGHKPCEECWHHAQALADLSPPPPEPLPLAVPMDESGVIHYRGGNRRERCYWTTYIGPEGAAMARAEAEIAEWKRQHPGWNDNPFGTRPLHLSEIERLPDGRIEVSTIYRDYCGD